MWRADLGMVKIELYVVFDRGQHQLPDAFYQIKKKWFLTKVIAFRNLENTGKYITHADLFEILKPIFSSILSTHLEI